jgi:hypothetical protein
MLNLSGRSASINRGHGQGTIDRHNTLIYTAAALAHENIQGDAIWGKIVRNCISSNTCDKFRCIFINKNPTAMKFDKCFFRITYTHRKYFKIISQLIL